MIKGFTYILTNKNFSVLYIGATKDLRNRIDCHRDGKGAVFTKKYNATILLYFEEFEDYKDAFVREKQLKNWHKDWKWNMVKVPIQN
jgi:putative endonuclease